MSNNSEIPLDKDDNVVDDQEADQDDQKSESAAPD